MLKSRTNTKKRCLFHQRGLEYESRKSRNTWSNRPVWPWSTKGSRAKANRVLSRKCTGHSKHPLPVTQEMTLHMISPDCQYLIEIDYILHSQRWRSSIVSENKIGSWLWLRSWTPFAKFRLKLKKVEKTTRLFRYDLNQISYDSTGKVTNRFKEFDLIDGVPEELWFEVCDTV